MDPINQNPGQPEQTPNETKKVGPIIASLVIVLVLIFAALYVFASRVSQSTETNQMTDPATTTQRVQPVTNTSDDLQSIQADLKASTKGVDSQNF